MKLKLAHMNLSFRADVAKSVDQNALDEFTNTLQTLCFQMASALKQKVGFVHEIGLNCEVSGNKRDVRVCISSFKRTTGQQISTNNGIAPGPNKLESPTQLEKPSQIVG